MYLTEQIGVLSTPVGQGPDCLANERCLLGCLSGEISNWQAKTRNFTANFNMGLKILI